MQSGGLQKKKKNLSAHITDQIISRVWNAVSRNVYLLSSFIIKQALPRAWKEWCPGLP